MPGLDARTRTRLQQLCAAGALSGLVSVATAENPPGSGESSASEVQRLHQLLRGQWQEPRDPTATADITTASAESTPTRLSGEDGRAYLAGVRTDPGTVAAGPDQRTEDIVYHIEVRNGGELVASRAWNFKALGFGQYWCLVALHPGEVRIKVQGRDWSFEHDVTARAPYLLFYTTAPGSKASLLLMSTDALQLPAWENRPDWVPALPRPATSEPS